MKAEKKLSPEQQVFAEENLKIVYSFLHSKNLSIEEYFDIVIFGYIKAVKEYTERPDIQKYSFTTIAFRKMETTLVVHAKHHSRQKRKEDIPALRLDAKCSLESDDELYEVITTVEDFTDTLISQLYWERILNRLTATDRNLIAKILDGYSVAEIASQDGISTQAVYQRLGKIRKRLRPE